MDLLSRDDLALLIQQPQPPCVSLYLPTYRAGREAQQGPIRLKNLIHRAAEGLVDTGVRRPDAGEILRPARMLVEDPTFWRHQSDGVAMFLRAGWFRRFRLPIAFVGVGCGL